VQNKKNGQTQHAQKNMLKHIKHCGSFKSKNKTKGMQKGL